MESPTILTRSAMFKILEGHGWTVKTRFYGDESVIDIDPNLGGVTISVTVPEFVRHNHAPAMEQVYRTVGDLVEKNFKRTGVA
jgi:hypothetical protein